MNCSALIGKPTDHSISHVLFELLADAASLGEYKHIKIDLEEDELPAALAAFRTLKFKGINITLPYKLKVMEHLDRLDDEVQALGAVNTVTFGDTMTGHNTDWRGIVRSLQDKAPAQTYERAVIFGNGGAARAAIYACKQLGSTHVTVLYRVKASDKAAGLMAQQETLGITIKEYSHAQSEIAEAGLVINATSAGMVGMAPVPFETSELDGIDMYGKVYFDAVFNPVRTPLLEYFESRGADTVDGLWMMIHQATAALSLWLDRPVTIDDRTLAGIHTRLTEQLAHV